MYALPNVRERTQVACLIFRGLHVRREAYEGEAAQVISWERERERERDWGWLRGVEQTYRTYGIENI